MHRRIAVCEFRPVRSGVAHTVKEAPHPCSHRFCCISNDKHKLIAPGAVCSALFVSDPVRVGCFLSSPAVWGLVRELPFLRCWSALVGRLFVLECAFWGFLLLFALLHLCPLLRLLVSKNLSHAPALVGCSLLCLCTFGGFLL